jgi:hypothetical protein
MSGLSADEAQRFESLSPYLGILLMALLTILFAAMLGTIVVV